MEQETLSHRKGNAGEHIEMTNLPETRASSVKNSSSKDVAVEEISTTNGQRDLRSNLQKKAEKIQFATLCWSIFLAGWNDGTTGPLLPRIQEVYHVRLHSKSQSRTYPDMVKVNFTIVSLIFIFACLVSQLSISSLFS